MCGASPEVREKRGTMAVKEYDEKNVVISEATCVRESKKAVLVRVEGKEFWVPQSQVHKDSEVWVANDQGKLIISKWIAIERGLWEKEED